MYVFDWTRNGSIGALGMSLILCFAFFLLRLVCMISHAILYLMPF